MHGQLRRAETGKADRPLLLLACGRSILLLDFAGEQDRATFMRASSFQLAAKSRPVSAK
ncbi:hypothetical protein ACOJBO_07940 [Rhizobium beringeri]